MQCASNIAFRAVLVATIAALAGAPLRSGPAQAGDDAGAREFIASQAARSAAPPESRMPVASASAAEVMRPYLVAPRRTQRRAIATVKPAAPRAHGPKVQYVKFSETEERRPAQPKKAVALPSDPVAAVLRDPTLEPGDIVVLRDGPKVFAGPGKFEPVEQSKLLSKGARKAVLAMIQPPQNLAGQARQRVALPSPISSEGAALASAVRVVYPRVLTP